MRRAILTLASCLGLGLPAALCAEEAVVVELYTSQGCSSCPPADALLARLAAREDLITLALHVDYWDYIGWTDTFGLPQASRRQKAYAKAMQETMVYTPQIIVHGEARLKAPTEAELERAIDGLTIHPEGVTIRAHRSGEGLVLSAAANGAGPVTVQLVRYRPVETVAIERGENAGAVIDYHNIVTDWAPLGDWDGEGRFEMTAPLPGDDPAVVIVQRQGLGPILAAYKLD